MLVAVLAAASTLLGAGSPAAARAAAAPRVTGSPVAHLVRATPLRSSPGGPVVARLTTKTRWGSPRYLPIVRRSGGWLGVIAAERPNGELGWIRAGATTSAIAPLRLIADLSDRELRVLRAGRTVLRVRVGVGGPATPTPTGRFAVTDGLHPAAGSPYGCCILALSGHQPNVPQGWTGGDRLAIHGTTDPASIGRASSSGCLRASDRDLRRLLAVVGLGTTITIRP